MNALATGDDFVSSDQFEILLPEFSYESCLILPAVSSFDTPLLEVLRDPIIQDMKKLESALIIHDIAETSAIPQDKLANVMQQKPESAKVLERIAEFSNLMPEYLRAISGYLEFLDRGEPSEELQIVLRKIKSGTVQFEHKSAEDASKELMNDSQTDELNDELKKRDIPRQSELQEKATSNEKELVEIKTFETVETQTVVTGNWPCKHCSELSEDDGSFVEQPFVEGELSTIAGLANTSPNSNDFFKSSLKSVVAKIKNSKSEPGSRKGIVHISIARKLAHFIKDFPEELIINNELPAEEVGKFKKDTSNEKSALIQCSHQSTIQLQLKIRNFRKSTKAVRNAIVTEVLTINSKDSRRDVSVPEHGRSWLRAYLTARLIKKFENEDQSSKLQAKDQLEDLGVPVLIRRTYYETEHNFLSSNLLSDNFLSSLRLWYFARKLYEYEASENQQA